MKVSNLTTYYTSIPIHFCMLGGGGGGGGCARCHLSVQPPRAPLDHQQNKMQKLISFFNTQIINQDYVPNLCNKFFWIREGRNGQVGPRGHNKKK